MKIIRPKVKARIVKVSDLKRVNEEAQEIIKFMDTKGKLGNYDIPEHMAALADAQCNPNPWDFFVLSKDFEKDFGSRVIINCHIKNYDTSFMIDSEEGCFSYPYRKPKKVMRTGKLDVEYWIPWLKWMRPQKRHLEGLYACLVQHECEHNFGNSIYEKNSV